MTPPPLIDAWLAYLAAERGLSSHTLASYAQDIRHIHRLGESPGFDAIQHHDIRRLVNALHQRGLSGRSLARMLSAWRSFYRYLIKRHAFRHNPCDKFRSPGYPQAFPPTLSVDRTQRLLAPTGERHRLSVRDQALFELMYSSGLRLTEVAQLTLSQLDLHAGDVRVIGKGNKTRIVPLGRMANAALAAWLSQRDIHSEFVFPGRSPHRHLSQRAIELRLAQRAQQSELGEHVHPHMLRHAFASHLLQSSGDLRAVQDMLGHDHIRSTQVYTRLDFQHLAHVYDFAHPRAKQKV